MSSPKRTKVDFKFQLVGVQYYIPKDARDILESLIPFGVELRRDKKNKHDENAIKVVIPSDADSLWKGQQIGHIPATAARVLAPALDEGRIEFLYGRLNELNPYTGKGMGVATFIKISKPPLTTKSKSAKLRTATKSKPKKQ